MKDMTDTPGWEILNERMEDQINYYEGEADKLQENTLKLLKDGKTLEEIQTRAMLLKERARGLKEVRNIISRVISNKKVADKRIRENQS